MCFLKISSKLVYYHAAIVPIFLSKQLKLCISLGIMHYISSLCFVFRSARSHPASVRFTSTSQPMLCLGLPKSLSAMVSIWSAPRSLSISLAFILHAIGSSSSLPMRSISFRGRASISHSMSLYSCIVIFSNPFFLSIAIMYEYPLGGLHFLLPLCPFFHFPFSRFFLPASIILLRQLLISSCFSIGRCTVIFLQLFVLSITVLVGFTSKLFMFFDFGII